MPTLKSKWKGEKQDISKSFANLTCHLPKCGPNCRKFSARARSQSMRGLSLHVQEVHRHSRCGGPPPVASSHGSVAAPWRSANPWLVAGRSAWRSASSASFPRDRQVVHDRRWPVTAKPRSLIHVAVARGSRSRSVFAKSRTDS